MGHSQGIDDRFLELFDYVFQSSNICTQSYQLYPSDEGEDIETPSNFTGMSSGAMTPRATTRSYSLRTISSFRLRVLPSSDLDSSSCFGVSNLRRTAAAAFLDLSSSLSSADSILDKAYRTR